MSFYFICYYWFLVKVCRDFQSVIILFNQKLDFSYVVYLKINFVDISMWFQM